nr:vegetative cell wall protein gp1-like [Aegilops tauschii subsp. strangulata]
MAPLIQRSGTAPPPTADLRRRTPTPPSSAPPSSAPASSTLLPAGLPRARSRYGPETRRRVAITVAWRNTSPEPRAASTPSPHVVHVLPLDGFPRASSANPCIGGMEPHLPLFPLSASRTAGPAPRLLALPHAPRPALAARPMHQAAPSLHLLLLPPFVPPRATPRSPWPPVPLPAMPLPPFRRSPPAAVPRCWSPLPAAPSPSPCARSGDSAPRFAQRPLRIAGPMPKGPHRPLFL